MKHWYSLPPFEPKHMAFYGFILYALLVFSMRISRWPNIFPAWGIDGVFYSKEFLEGLLALTILIVVFVLLVRGGIHTLTPLDRVYSGAIAFSFFLIPIFNVYAIGVASAGFTINPSSRPDLTQWYKDVSNIQSNVMVIGMFLFLIPIFIMWYRQNRRPDDALPAAH